MIVPNFDLLIVYNLLLVIGVMFQNVNARMAPSKLSEMPIRIRMCFCGVSVALMDYLVANFMKSIIFFSNYHYPTIIIFMINYHKLTTIIISNQRISIYH